MKSFIQALHESSDVALQQHQDHFPRGAELSLQALKGHLLIEELLRNLVESKLPRPAVLSASSAPSFSCSQMICLAEALVPDGQSGDWIWDAIKKLNSLRNKLAHRLDYRVLQDDLGKFTTYCVEKQPDIRDDMKALGVHEGALFECCIMSISTFILAFRAMPPDNSFKPMPLRGTA